MSEETIVSKGKAPSRFLLPIVLLAVCIAVGIWTSIKAHEYYYPDNQFGLFLTEPRVTFTAERPGRYEINYEDELGELTFDVIEMKTGASVPVTGFSLLAEIVNTVGYRGHAFYIESPGSYQLSVQPWHGPEARVYLNFSDHQAIAYWTLGGIALGGLLGGISFVLFIAMLPKREPVGQTAEDPKASDL